MEGKGKEKWPAIGIDLGTTYSCVGVWKHGRVEIIANDQGNRTTPSCVAFTKNQVLVGEAAANQAIQDPTNTIFDAKRLIGRRFDDKSIKSDKNFWPFKVIESPVHNNKPMIAVTYRNQQKQFSAEQISSMILSKMKETAEAYLGSEVKKAVVTVPAYFNDSQRQATKDAGTIAGLDVIRIINEPTAAAIAYGLDNQMVTGTNKVAKNVLVFDLGGGTCDVSLVTIGKRSFEVKAVSGDPHLGGEDFNNRMVQYFVAEIKVKNNKDISNTPRAVKRLRNACEVAKRTLSAANETDIYLECLFDRIDFSEKITRARFEYLNQDLFTECIDLVEKCLKDANMRKDDVDDVVLVGGSSRIVKIQELLKDFFNGKDLCKSINPDEAIAYGAAIQAAKLSDTGNIKDFALVDVIPLSLGIQLYTEEMRVVIPKNTTIPVKKFNDKLVTAEDNQESVTFSIYEGEKEIAKENNFLGKFELCGIPPAPKGEHKLKVSFEIDSNGILTVTAYHEASDKKNQIIITDVRSRLSSAEIEQMIKEAEKCKAEDMEYKKAMKSKLALQEYAEQNQETLRKFNKNKKKLEKAKTAIDNTIQWLDSLDLNSTLCNAREFEVRLKELKYTVDPFTAML